MSKLENAFSGKPIAAVDFDGVLHQYDGWNDGKLNRPIDGAKDGIQELIRRGFRVVVFSTRDEAQIRGFLTEHEFPEMEICSEKPPAMVFLDDRCVKFDGRWSRFLIDEVAHFRPYWERERGV